MNFERWWWLVTGECKITEMYFIFLTKKIILCINVTDIEYNVKQYSSSLMVAAKKNLTEVFNTHKVHQLQHALHHFCERKN